MSFDEDGYRLGPGEGEGIWFLGTLMTIKAGGDQTHGAFTRLECLAPAGFAPPLHIHQAEEEAFYVLEGELTVTCGDRTWTAAPGAFVLLPRGIPHSFAVSDAGPAKLLQITSPAQFERFAAEVGEPAQERTLPPPAQPDVAKLLRLAGEYNIEIGGHLRRSEAAARAVARGPVPCSSLPARPACASSAPPSTGASSGGVTPFSTCWTPR